MRAFLDAFLGYAKYSKHSRTQALKHSSKMDDVNMIPQLQPLPPLEPLPQPQPQPQPAPAFTNEQALALLSLVANVVENANDADLFPHEQGAVSFYVHQVNVGIAKSRSILIESLTKLDALLLAMTEETRTAFIEQASTLASVHTLLQNVALNAKTMAPNSNSSSISKHMLPVDFAKSLTTLIRAVFRVTLNNHWKRSATSVFERFVSGITHFKSDHESNVDFGLDVQPKGAMLPGPVYHRIASCGIGTNEFRSRFLQCLDRMGIKERQEVNARVQTCYIERLIYAEIYTTLSSDMFRKRADSRRGQDAKHVDALDRARKDFASCFPDVHITVQISWHSDPGLEGVPMSATITRVSPFGDGNLSTTSTETYTRHLKDPEDASEFRYAYLDEVSCEKITPQSGTRFVKVQSYASGVMTWELQGRTALSTNVLRSLDRIDAHAMKNVNVNPTLASAAPFDRVQETHKDRTFGLEQAHAPPARTLSSLLREREGERDQL